MLNPWNLDGLQEIERETGKRIYNILQLRHHKSIINLKKKIDSLPKDKIHDIDLTYITSRGKWYHYSWKGDISKSGGVVTNIGIHFFDMLGWIFGNVKSNILHLLKEDKASGLLQLENANIRWYLSIDKHDLPIEATSNNLTTYRSITVDNDEFEFSGGFTDLHTESYNSIIHGNGFGIEDAKNSIEIAHLIRNQEITKSLSEAHPILKK